jgi:hypothetical protein
MAISRDAPGPAVRRRRTCCDECQCGSRRGLDVGEGGGTYRQCAARAAGHENWCHSANSPQAENILVFG